MKILLNILIILSIPFLLSGCDNKNNNTTNTGENNNINISRTSITKDLFNNSNTNEDNQFNNNSNEQYNINPEPKETEISNFSTPLKSGGANRLTNIKLTCNKINGMTLKQGESFSFNQIVGPCTAEEGYLKAEIYVKQKIQYALGGGNCQVSTTLYNAALAIPRNKYYRKT